MNEELIKKMIQDTYDDSREDGVLWMALDFYSKKMASLAIMVWAFAIAFFAGAVYCGFEFFSAEQTKYQILYAVIFGLFVEGVALMKIFAWQMLARNSVKREIKRLELRIAELNQTVKDK
jgi:hypothetical protein